MIKAFDGRTDGDLVQVYKLDYYGIQYTIALFGTMEEFINSTYAVDLANNECYACILADCDGERIPVFELEPTIFAKDDWFRKGDE